MPRSFLVIPGATGARGVASVVPSVLAIAEPFLEVLLPVRLRPAAGGVTNDQQPGVAVRSLPAGQT